MNTVCLLGRTTRNPEFSFTRNENDMARFTLAVDDRDETYFIPCTAFGKTAEFMEKYMDEKGIRIGVMGKLTTGQYTDHDGETRYTWNVIAQQVFFADAKKQENVKEDEKRDDNRRNNKRTR